MASFNKWLYNATYVQKKCVILIVDYWNKWKTEMEVVKYFAFCLPILMLFIICGVSFYQARYIPSFLQYMNESSKFTCNVF